MLQVLAVWHVLVSIALVGLIMMHSGRDAGLGGMGFTPASQGGTHIVERNLTRVTIAVAILALAGCGSSQRTPLNLAVAGPPATVRVALERVRWPIAPRDVRTRDD